MSRFDRARRSEVERNFNSGREETMQEGGRNGDRLIVSDGRLKGEGGRKKNRRVKVVQQFQTSMLMGSK